MKVAFSPDGTHLAVAVFADKEGNNDIVIWDIQQQKIVKRLKKHKLAVSNIIFSEELVSASFDGSINIWHWKTATIENTFQYNLPITSIDLSSYKQLLAIGFQNCNVQLRELNTEKNNRCHKTR